MSDNVNAQLILFQLTIIIIQSMLDQFKVEYNFYFLLEQHNRLRNRSHVINQGKSIFDRSCVCTIEPIIDYDFFRQLNTLIQFISGKHVE